VRQEYEKHLKDELGDDWEDPEEKAKCMEPIIAWYKEQIANELDDRKSSGTIKSSIGNLALKLTQLVRLLFISTMHWVSYFNINRVLRYMSSKAFMSSETLSTLTRTTQARHTARHGVVHRRLYPYGRVIATMPQLRANL